MNKRNILVVSVSLIVSILFVTVIQADSPNDISTPRTTLVKGKQAIQMLLDMGYTQEQVAQMRKQAQSKMVQEIIDQVGEDEAVHTLQKAGLTPNEIDELKEVKEVLKGSSKLKLSPDKGVIVTPQGAGGSLQPLFCSSGQGGLAIFETLPGPMLSTFQTSVSPADAPKTDVCGGICIYAHTLLGRSGVTIYSNHVVSAFAEHITGTCF